MQIFLSILLIFLAYILLFSAVPFLLAFLLPGKDIYKKTQVFLSTFGMPITFSTVILVDTFSKNHFFNIIALGILIVSVILRLIFADEKYVTSFNLGTTTVEIEYLTPLLKTKQIILDTNDLSGFEILKANWVVGYPASISIRYKKDWLTFELTDKKLKENIEKQITAANKSVCNSSGH